MTKLTATATLYLCTAALATLVAGACGDDDAGDGANDDDSPGADAAPPDESTDPLVEERPYAITVPASYAEGTATPVLMVLHGFTANGTLQAGYFGLVADAEEHGYLLVVPEGLPDSQNRQFWNATDFCCNFEDIDVDDVAYLRAVLRDVAKKYTVDDRRVYVAGHSNGGFMAHRLACEIGDEIAAIVSLAGAQWLDAAKCPAADDVNVLQVHGDMDDVIRYAGSGDYPSAAVTVATWQDKNGCTGELTTGDPLDIDSSLAGSETVTASTAGCPTGGAVDLWTIVGGSHTPALSPAWADSIWAWLAAHPKP